MLIDLLESSKPSGLCPMGKYISETFKLAFMLLLVSVLTFASGNFGHLLITCKWFLPRAGLTKYLDPNCLRLMVFLTDFFSN